MNQVDQHLLSALPTPGDWQPTDLRRAAVFCPIVKQSGEDHLLFVVRPMSTQSHPGQIAFPGGMQQAAETPVQTALRECTEEIGIPAAQMTPLGELTPRKSTSQIHVHCVVGRISNCELRLDPREVARVIHIPVEELRDATRWQEKPPPVGSLGKQPATSPHFVSGDDVLWGLTARFTRELMKVLDEQTS